MLRKNFQDYVSKTGEKGISLYKEEAEYAKMLGFLKEEVNILDGNDYSAFNNAYLELSNKETDELVAEKTAAFFNEPIAYFKQHIEQFIYIEAEKFEIIGADSVCLEVDDVFGTYEVMLGLRMPKKLEKNMKAAIDQLLTGETKKYSLLFNGTDGLWELNFALNGVDGFDPEMTIGEAFAQIHHFLFQVAIISENKQD
jgi:hypothetical protein